MKICFILLAILIYMLPAAAQEEMQTLLDKKQPVKVGGYGGPSVRFTTFDQKPVFMVGGYGGVLINQKLMLGGGGYGMATQYSVPATFSDNYRRHWEMGYGGFVSEYIINPNRLIHVHIGALIGVGGVSKVYWGDDDLGDEADSFDDSAFFVAEPYFGIEMNVLKFMRFAVNGSYRYISGSSTEGITDADLNAPTLGMALKFGKF